MSLRAAFLRIVVALLASIAFVWLGACVAPATITPPAPTIPPTPTIPPAPTIPIIPPTPGAPSACMIILPDMTVQPCDAVEPPVTAAARDAACAPITPFEADKAGKVAQDAGLLAGWTLGVNFDVAREGRPLACLRLYHLAGAPDAPIMEAVDQGGILVDTCSVDDAEYDPANGWVRFCGAGRVTCSTELGAWFTDSEVQNLVAGSALARGNAGDAASIRGDIELLAVDGGVATYPELTLVAQTYWASREEPICARTNAVQPLFSISPTNQSEPAHALTLFAPDGTSGPVVFGSNCTKSWYPDDAWNLSFSTLASETGSVIRSYVNRLDVSGATTEDSACGLPATTSITVWQGTGVLTIGADDQVSNDGVIDGILIDPLDSRPPS